MKFAQYLILIVLGIALGVGGYLLFEALGPKPEPIPQDDLIGGRTKEEIAEEFLRDLESGVYDDIETEQSIIE